MAQNQNKLVGTQYLDLTRLRKDVGETNTLLKSIGTGVNLNMTDVVEKQVRKLLKQFQKEIQEISAQTGKSGQKMANSLQSASTQIRQLLTTTQKLAKDGSVTEIRKGYDELGRAVTEVYKAGQLLNRSMSADSSYKKDLETANRLYQEQLRAIRQIYQMKTQRLKADEGSQLAQNLDKQISDVQTLIDGNKRIIASLDQQAVKRSRLVSLAQEEMRLTAKYQNAQVAAGTKAGTAAETAQLKAAQQAYNQLTTAHRQYIQTLKNGNAAGQSYWEQSANSAMNELRALEKKLPSLNLEEGIRKKIVDLIRQAENAEATHQRNLDDMNGGASELDQTLDKIGSRLIQMATTMLVLRGQTAIWKNATDYAQEFYDKLNEIKIVTGKSEAEVQKLGQSYRKLAAQMNVTSTEIASAAVEFWRQGLDESEVNARLVAATQYAKISAMEFDEAAELITAATNTMEVSAQRVVDVFAYLGDASASGADEIGIAMQKASASALEFGVSFEWLGAYIATVSEQTRQAPEVIGTSLNSIMARLHSIKASGYNEEDETKINDVAKALSTIDVALMDNEGNWRDMSDVFIDIAGKWDTLDSKTRSYIATVMAGTRQQNYFLALMTDMAKGAEGGSRAFELYEGALAAAGTAAQKYAVWQESVTAAQNRLTTALEGFYALLDADWMKKFYNSMADVVTIITIGTDAMNGWNIMIPIAAAAIMGLIAVIYKAVVAFKALKAAMAAGNGIASMMSGGWVAAIGAALGVIAMLVTSVVGAASASAELEKIDYSATISSVSGYRENIAELVDELETLSGRTELTAEEQARADEIMRKLSGTSLSMKAALENGGEGFDTLGEKAAAARGEVEKTEQALRSLKTADALQNLRDADNAYLDSIAAAQQNRVSASRYGDISSVYGAYMQEHSDGRYTEVYSGPMGTAATKEENFYTYAKQQARTGVPIWSSREDKAAAQESMAFWSAVVEELDQLGIDATSSVEEISNKMLEFDIAAASYLEAGGERLNEAWQPVFDDLYTVMINGTNFTQLPSFMQQAATTYYEAYVGAIDQQAELAEGDLMAMASDLTSYVDKMYESFMQDADVAQLMERYDELLAGPQTQETVDELNALIPVINEFIAIYNALNDTAEDDIPLLPEFTLDNLQAVQTEAEAAGKALATLDAADIYKGLALAREEANGFASVLSKLGEGEGQMLNLHDAVMATAQEIAAASGITESAEIAKIGEALLDSLYDTYPGIADYVDVSTGMLLDGWQEGVADATNPWLEMFETARLEDALNKAKKDMASLDVSALWTELLDPGGMGLYAFAEEWARRLLPDGTETEIHALAAQYVETFFQMFADIDTTIMDADGRIASGMEGIISTMREGVYEAHREVGKLEAAYENLHADRLAREEASAGLTAMMGMAQAGDSSGVSATFEGLSAESINVITEAMPELIDKLYEGAYTAEDFAEAMRLIGEMELKDSMNAWSDYLDGTTQGARAQGAAYAEAMRTVIAEVSAVEDKTAAFYEELSRLSGEGVDISGLLDQYGYLGVLLLGDTKSAEELYAMLLQMENMDALQLDLSHADSLAQAALAIDPSNASYDPMEALTAFELLEEEYAEQAGLQRGSAEYIAKAKALTDQTTASVYEQAAAYGVVTDIQARSAQYAVTGQRDKRFANADANAYTGGVDFLSSAVRDAEAAGEDIAQAWSNALSELDEAGVLEGMTQMFGDISLLAVECGGDVEEIIRRIYEMQDAAKSVSLEDIAVNLRSEREDNTAETAGYQEQIDALTAAFGEGGVEGVQAATDMWNSFDSSLQQSIAETYPSLVISLDEANRAAAELESGFADLADAENDMDDVSRTAEKSIESLGKELGSTQKNANAKYFKNTAKAIEDLKHGAIDASEAFGDYYAEAQKAIKANEEYQAAGKKMAAGTKVTVDEISNLAAYLGNIDPSVLLANWDMVGPMISNALAEGESAFDRLNEAAFIVITGTSVADFSALTNGLVSVQNLAADAVEALIATGQWTLETITLPQEGAQWDPISGTWNISKMNTGQSVLRYTGSNPLRTGGSGSSGKSGSGGGGSGGGGSSKTEVSKSIQKMLDNMDEEQGLEDHRRRLFQLAQEYHETRGEIQGVILYLEKEKQLVAGNTTTLQQYVDTLAAQIAQKQAELSKYKEGSKKYKQALADLEALQAAHQQYSEELWENRTDLEKLQQQIEEWHNTVRQMEIDLREEIHQAILDREELNRRMLEGRIDLENELIDVLTRQYEIERDELIEIAELKREALNEELELQDKQLEARKKLSEEQDRAKELAEKEAQLARISADPTRKKEELKLREEIAALREEIAWELAEEEVEAQKESIASQIENIDDYIEYVEKYYEELLANPRKLIEELQELLTRTDEEILDWLTQNHEGYQTATDATREEMRLGWIEMLDDMRGNTQSYWDEVEEIIAQGDEAIIDFLKENRADYQEAGKLQAEAYVDEWLEQLEALKKAYQAVSDAIQNTTYTSTSSSKTSSSGSSSGGSSSSKSSATTTKQFVASGTGYAEAYRSTATSVSYGGATYVKDPKSNYWYKTSDAQRIDGGRTWYWKTGTTRYVKKYLEGGLATGAGLAWLDGTTQRPERILSPYQTELFEDLLKTLHSIRTVQAPASVVTPHLPKTEQQSFNIEQITVQVQKLESEQDYEEMAERVGEHIMEKVSRGMAVGGIRLG